MVFIAVYCREIAERNFMLIAYSDVIKFTYLFVGNVGSVMRENEKRNGEKDIFINFVV